MYILELDFVIPFLLNRSFCLSVQFLLALLVLVCFATSHKIHSNGSGRFSAARILLCTKNSSITDTKAMLIALLCVFVCVVFLSSPV